MLVFLLLLLGCIAFAVVREMSKAQPRPADLRGHIRARGWGVLLLPVAVMAGFLTGPSHVLAAIELAVAGALVAWAPRLAAKLVPYTVLALAGYGVLLARGYHDGATTRSFTEWCSPEATPGAPGSSFLKPSCSSSSACGCSSS